MHAANDARLVGQQQPFESHTPWERPKWPQVEAPAQ
ncbi:hypothetical protein PF003_g12917 [Phytophthora fragariae]|nr:hypothetical protein PF003_g12917 [Phytophthora fragariae]